MVRPRTRTDDLAIVQHHEAGYNDCQIAEMMGISRTTVARRRKDLGIQSNSGRGIRGIGRRSTEPYWVFVRKVFDQKRDLALLFRKQAAMLYEQGRIDYSTYFLCTCCEPSISRGIHFPGSSRKYMEEFSADFMLRKVGVEKAVDQSSMAGVPGPQFIQLVRVLKSASQETIINLVNDSIINAGFVNMEVTVSDHFSCTPAIENEIFWKTIKDSVGEWIKISHEWMDGKDKTDKMKKMAQKYQKREIN